MIPLTKNTSTNFAGEVFHSSHFNTDIFSTANSYDSGIEQISKPPSLVIAG
jgi:hypothetical protein